jgi:hypothetical protein
MLSNLESKYKAFELRRAGLSYKEIRAIIPVSKSTLSNWVSGLKLTEEEKLRLEKNVSKGRDYSRYMAGLTNTRKRIEREKVVKDEAEKEFELYKTNVLFFTGIALYWAEGGKKSKSFQFVNSDPEMIVLIIKWMEKFLKISKKTIKYRLYIHKPYANEKCEEFWALRIGISTSEFQKTVYKPTIHNVKKNIEYKGCFALVINSVDLFRKIMTWQKLLIEYYKEELMRP